MMKCVHLVLLLVLLAAGPVLAQKHKKKSKPAAPAAGLSLGLEKSPVFSKCFTGFALYDPARDSMLYAYQADRYFTPASNTKLLTLYASLKTLGDSIPALQYRREGDLLIFWGTGDPSFLNPHLRPDTLVYEFLRSRKETLLFCPANFKDQRYGSGWMWSDYPYSYQPEKSPFPVYSNVAHIRQPAGVQGQISVTPAFLKSRIRQDTSLHAEDYIGREEYDNQFIVNVLADRNSQVEWHVPFRYSPSFLAEVLSDTLKRPVYVMGAPLMPPPDAETIYHGGADSLYRLLMQESDNFVAEQLLLLCSWKNSGGVLNADSAMAHALSQHLGDLPDEPKWADGSGLSRYNLLTPRSLVALLDKIQEELPRERLLRIFAAGGVSGTLRADYRNGDKPYVYAKTGTLRNNHCLSGYLLTRKGRFLIFSFMNNNFTTSTSAVRKEMERVLRRVYETL